jgi:hypothetical protein
VKLTPEDLDKLQTKQLANVIRKLNAGKTLTAREEALLAKARAGGDVTEGVTTGFVQTWDELALALGTTRRAIQEWKKDPRYKAKCPRDRANGRKEVAAWSRFMVDHNLKRAAENVPSDDVHELGDDSGDVVHPPRLSGSQADWQKAVLREKHEAAKVDRLVTEGTLVIATELEMPLGATFATIQTKLSQFPGRVARYLVGLRDVAEIEDRLRDEIDADLSDLQAGRFTSEAAVQEALSALPFDEESERLFKLVTFDGQDRAALRQLIAAVATQALRNLGRRALQNARREQEIPDTAVADEVTGQVTDQAAARESKRRSVGEVSPAPDQEAAAVSKTKKKRRSKPAPRKLPPAVEGAIYREPRKR